MKKLDRINVLVTAVGGDISQGVIKCLKESHYAVNLFGCDINPYAAGREDVDNFFVAPPVGDGGKYRIFLQDIIQEKKIDYVFPLFEPELLWYTKHKEFFKDSRASFMVLDETMVTRFLDKYHTVLWFKEHNLPYPETFLAAKYQDQLPYPLILKRRFGSGSHGLIKINGSEELAYHLPRNPDAVVQEYLCGEDSEYTAGLFCDGEQVISICFKRILGPGGYSQQVQLVNDRQINEFLHQVCLQLEFKGSINLQFRKTAKGLIPFEINPRFSSTVYFRHVFGFRDVEWALDLKQGKAVAYIPKYKSGIGVRKFTETFFDLT